MPRHQLLLLSPFIPGILIEPHRITKTCITDSIDYFGFLFIETLNLASSISLAMSAKPGRKQLHHNGQMLMCIGNGH